MSVSTALAVGDQAQVLRDLMQRLHASHLEPGGAGTARRACAVAIASGKGGVGKSNLALNVAIALARLDAATCLLYANLGLGSIDLLCGLNGYWNLSHVATGGRSLKDVVLPGPEGIDVIPGAGALAELCQWPATAQSDVLGQLNEFESRHDFLVIDTAAGIHRLARSFLDAADVVVVVTTPEPTSVADAYATIKALSGNGVPTIEVLVNQCSVPDQAAAIAGRICETARLFLHTSIGTAGFIPHDPRVTDAVARRRPILVDSPDSPASVAIHRLASRLKDLDEKRSPRGSFFSRMQLCCLRGPR